VRLRWQFQYRRKSWKLRRRCGSAAPVIRTNGNAVVVVGNGVPVKLRTLLTGAKTPPAWENKPLNFPDDPGRLARTPRLTRRSCTHGEDVSARTA